MLYTSTCGTVPGTELAAPCSLSMPRPSHHEARAHLLTDEAEAPVRTLTLIGLPQDRVEGLAARPVVRGGVGRDSKGCDVHLWEEGQEDAARGIDLRRSRPSPGV